MSSVHPPLDVLLAWNRGELPADQFPNIESHVENCPQCSGALVSADHSADALVSNLRQAVQTPSNELTAGILLGGRYKLVERIGDGGMGTVWMARQNEPVRRSVAVKLIKSGMDSAAVLNRFEAERQALALMDHPNIAKVLDAGILQSPAGSRPYVVMELVKGVVITRYCDEQRLTLRERLELFVPVCQAIQHAHQKGIIHRDIKPSNVLVGHYDDRPVPKIIDFGVAKAIGQPLTEHTLHTGIGAVVGTPEYMSPEQASFNNFDVDTRSDVYSLGVLLYELLTGSLPHSETKLDQAGLIEVLRVIREVDPPRPSHRLSTCVTLASVAAARSTDTVRLKQSIRGELDWIVMKCLEKNRNRRYDTASSLANDINRYITGEPVKAVPPSFAYRTRKFIHKYRGPVFATTFAFFALAIGATAATIGLLQAHRDRSFAVESAKAAEKANDRAQANLQEVSNAHSEMATLVLFISRQLKAKQGDAALQYLSSELNRMASRIDQKSYVDPKLNCEMHFRIGLALRMLDQHQAASQQIQKSIAEARTHLGANSPQEVSGLVELATIERANGNTSASDRFRSEAIRTFNALLKSPTADTGSRQYLLLYLREWSNEPEMMVQLAEHILNEEKQTPDPSPIRLIHAIHHVAWAKLQAREFEDAAKMEQQVLRMVQDFSEDQRRDLFYTIHYDAHMLFQRAGRIDDESLAILKKFLAPQQVATGILAARGAELLRLKEWKAAEPYLLECLSRRETEEADSWTVFNTKSMLGESLAGQEKNTEAETLLVGGYQGLKVRKDKIPSTALVRLTEAAKRLSDFYLTTGRPDQAAALLREIAEIPIIGSPQRKQGS